jgi:alpha-1,6-mannosyltransferase
MVIFNPDGSHGMYSWVHVGVATTCALIAWRKLSKPSPAHDAALLEPGENAVHRQGGRW